MTKRAPTGKAALAGKGAGKAPGGRAVAAARLLALEGEASLLVQEGEAEAEPVRAEAGKAQTELGTTVIKCLSIQTEELLLVQTNCPPTASGVNCCTAQDKRGSLSFLNFVHTPEPPSRSAEAGGWTDEHAGKGEAGA